MNETEGLLGIGRFPFGRLRLGDGRLKSLRYVAGLALLGVALLLLDPGGPRPAGLLTGIETTGGGAESNGDAVRFRGDVGAFAAAGGESGDRTAETAARLERELSGILAQMGGAGSVDVEVVLKTSGRRTYAVERSTDRSETREQDSAIDRRVVDESVTETFVTVRNEDGSDEPILVYEERPEVAGVLVVAEGASRAETRWALVDAVSTLLDIPPHRVAVYPK